MFKKYQPNFRNKFTPKTSWGNFKVRGPIKSFRDLDVYNKSTELSADIFTLRASKDSGLSEELALLKNLSKHIPKMIAESYGNRFDNFAVAERKLEKTAEVISSIIAKIDFILSVLKKEQGKVVTVAVNLEAGKEIVKDEVANFKKRVEGLLRDYTVVRVKVLNLKRSWVRLNEKFGKKT